VTRPERATAHTQAIPVETTATTGEQVTEPTNLRALSERIERMREEERTRIARELHDELGQLLTGIKLDFAAAIRRLHELKTPGDVIDKLQSAMGQIDIGIAMVRRIATDLRPAALDHRDLASAIEDEARRVSARARLDIQVLASIRADLPSPIATACFRIFQEAVTNAVRHSEATAIRAVISTTRRRLRMGVHDNGLGIPAGRSVNESLGMLGMSERARSVGGTLRIRSSRSRGTLVFLSVPLEQV
jgi:signal transduction histidine kinase